MRFQKREVGSQSGSDKFLKLQDGEPRTLCLQGEIYEFYVKWVNKKPIIVNENDPEGNLRFKVNAIVYEDGVFRAKIWEFPLTVYNQLADINSEYPLESIKIKVTRQGIAPNVNYHILPLLSEKDRLTPALLEKIKAVELNLLDLKPKGSPAQDWAPDFGEPPPDDDEIPIPF